MKRFYSCLLLIFCWSMGYGQSPIIQELKDSNQVQLGLYFYPSTLRMLNIQKDKAYDEMIKGIEQLSLLLLNPNKFTRDNYFDVVDKLVNEDNYEEYIVLDGPEYELQVMGLPKKQEMIGMAKYEDRFYLFDLKGTIDLMQLPTFYENLTTQDSTMKNGFSYVFDLIRQNEERRQRKEKWQIERAEKQRREAEKRAQQRRDSLGIKIDSVGQERRENEIEKN